MTGLMETIEGLNQKINQARQTDTHPTSATKVIMTDIDGYMTGNERHINTDSLVTSEERHMLWSCVLNMHLHDKEKDIGALFYNVGDDQHYYGHFLAMFIMHTAAKFVSHDKRVYHVSDTQLVDLFINQVTRNLSLLSNVNFKNYVSNLRNKNFYVVESLGQSYRTYIDRQSTPVYKDIEQPWVVNFFQAFHHERNRIDKKHDLVLNIGDPEKPVVFAVYDPSFVCKIILEEYRLNPFFYCRTGDHTVVTHSDTDRVQEMYDKFNQLTHIQPAQPTIPQAQAQAQAQVPQWTGEFNLRNGQTIKRTLHNFSMGGLVCGRALNMNQGCFFNGVQLQHDLKLNINMTADEFIAALQKAGLL